VADLIGQSIGRYHILEQLGEGGMATVYKAYDTRLNRNVAVKIIRKGAFPLEQFNRIRLRFEREAKALAMLSHPNIVGVIDFGEFEGSPYLVLEYLPGGTLKQHLGRPVPWKAAASIILPIAHALQYAHEHNIIHRDVKPSNILITGTGERMLTDFGIAKVLDVDETHTLTGTGVGLGTPEYMSPEQGLGKTVDARTDVYSLGIIFYELLTGRKPYTADTPMAVVIKQINDPLPRPTQFVPDLPEKAEQVLLKALAKRPENRFQDMAAFAQALEWLIKGGTKPDLEQTVEQASEAEATRDLLEPVATGISGPPTGPRSSAHRRAPKWLPIAGAGALICILLAIAAGYLLLKNINSIQPSSPIENPALPLVAPPSVITASVTFTPTISSTMTPSLTSSPTPSLTPTDANSRLSSVDGMTMVYVPAGAFTMGSNASQFPDEKPAHQVVLDSFWIDKTEVTNAMFLQFVNATGYVTELEKQNISWLYDGSNWYSVAGAGWRNPFGMNSTIDDRMDHPVIQVTWNDAVAYCNWAGRRLPTEAEWEKAARGTDGNDYPWGNAAPSSDLANYGNHVGDTVPVGSYPGNASPYGALDMAGNVYEWVADWYSNTYYSVSPSSNPHGPTSGSHRVLRGGSWQLDSYRLHTYEREVSLPNYGNSNLGVRCAQDANP